MVIINANEVQLTDPNGGDSFFAPSIGLKRNIFLFFLHKASSSA